MGILQRISDFINGTDVINRNDVFHDSDSFGGYRVADWSSRFISSQNTPIQEAIFNTIADEFSKIDVYAERYDGKQIPNDPYNKILNQRTNSFLTPSAFKHLCAYQLVKYGNSMTYINRDSNGVPFELIPLDLENYDVGFGYKLTNGKVLLKMKNKKTKQIELIDYSNLIHLRLNSNDIFNGDKNEFIDGTNTLINILDTQLNVMLNQMLNDGEIRGIIKVGSASTGSVNHSLMSQEKKISKQQEVADRIRNAKGSILVLDSGEEWQSLNSPFESVSNGSIEKVTQLIYTFKGINERVINGTASFDEMEVFFNKTIAPIIEQFIEELNFKLLSEKDKKKIFIDFKRNPYEYISIEKAVDSAYKGAMFTTINEMRKMLYKLPPIENGDVLISNKNFTTEGNEGDENENH